MKLKIYFTDLLAFVPGKSGKQMTVVLPTAHQHQAQLRYQGLNGLVKKRTLKAEEITIKEAGCGSLNIAGYRAELRAFPTKETMESFEWVPNLPDKACRIREEVLGDKSNGVIAARVRLTEGKISTLRFVAVEDELDGELKIHAYSLKGKPGRAVADVVVYELPVDGDTVTLQFRKFGSKSLKQLPLKPSEEGIVEVHIRNLPPQSNGEERQGIDQNGHEQKKKLNPHFEHFFNIVQGEKPVIGGEDPLWVRKQPMVGSFDNPPYPGLVAAQASRAALAVPIDPENCWSCKTC